jgi:predicted nucleic acid-binding protein
MNERYAIDTNIAIYSYVGGEKSKKANELLTNGPYISVQLLNEFANVALKKLDVQNPSLDQAIIDITTFARAVRSLDIALNQSAQLLHARYKLSFYDALIVSAALFDDCAILYSEDMQHGLVIEDRLTIINPFKESAAS